MKTRNESAILLVSYNTEYKTWSIVGSLRYQCNKNFLHLYSSIFTTFKGAYKISIKSLIILYTNL